MLELHVEQPKPIHLHISGPVYPGPYGEYGGPYEVVPGEDEQVLATENMLAVENVVVRPIPPNYGRIAWDGTGILVY